MLMTCPRCKTEIMHAIDHGYYKCSQCGAIVDPLHRNTVKKFKKRDRTNPVYKKKKSEEIHAMDIMAVLEDHVPKRVNRNLNVAFVAVQEFERVQGVVNCLRSYDDIADKTAGLDFLKYCGVIEELGEFQKLLVAEHCRDPKHASPHLWKYPVSLSAEVPVTVTVLVSASVVYCPYCEVSGFVAYQSKYPSETAIKCDECGGEFILRPNW